VIFFCFFFRISYQNVEWISHLSTCAAYPAHLILLDYTITVFGEKYRLWGISLYKFSPSLYVNVFDPNILRSTQFSKCLSYSQINCCVTFGLLRNVKYLYDLNQSM
jgi:hypothetical protein